MKNAVHNDTEHYSGKQVGMRISPCGKVPGERPGFKRRRTGTWPVLRTGCTGAQPPRRQSDYLLSVILTMRDEVMPDARPVAS